MNELKYSVKKRYSAINHLSLTIYHLSLTIYH